MRRECVEEMGRDGMGWGRGEGASGDCIKIRKEISRITVYRIRHNTVYYDGQ